MAKLNKGPKKNKNKSPKKDSKPIDNHYRIPRPTGTTLLCQSIRRETNEKERRRMLNQVRGLIMAQYMSGGYRLNGKVVGLDMMAIYLGISLKEVMGYINRGNRDLGDLGKQLMSEEGLKQALGFCLKKTLEDKALASQQVDLMMVAQGPNYAPFISSTLNDALRGTFQATNNILNVVKLISGNSGLRGSSINVPDQAPDGSQSTTNGPRYLNTETALILIQAQPNRVPLLSDGKALGELYLDQGLEGLPEVVASRQGNDTSDYLRPVGLEDDLKAYLNHEERNEALGEIIDGTT